MYGLLMLPIVDCLCGLGVVVVVLKVGLFLIYSFNVENIINFGKPRYFSLV